jgi:rhamnose transport system substrate-binding protein
VKKSLILGLALGLTFATGAFAADPLKIVYVGKNTGNPYFDSITGGFQDACKQLGCDFLFVAPATAEATSQIPIIEAQIQRGVNVIAIAPNSPDALDQVLDEARAKKILVLTVNGDIVGNETHRDANILPVDFTKTGPDQVELMGSMIGYKGEIAILSATTEAPDQNTWIAAMNKTLKEDPKYKDMKLVATVYGDDQPEKSTTEMEALLSNYPDLVGVIAPTTVGVAAAAQVVQQRGIADKVHVTGLGLPSEMRDFI